MSANIPQVQNSSAKATGVVAFWSHLASVFYLLPKRWQNPNTLSGQLKASETDKFILFVLLTMIELFLHGSWYMFMLNAEKYVVGISNIVADDMLLSMATFALALFSLSILTIAAVLNIPENSKRWLWLQGAYVMMYLSYGLMFTMGFGENTSAVSIMFLGSMVLGLLLLRWRFILAVYIIAVLMLVVFLLNQQFNYIASLPSLYPSAESATHPLWKVSHIYLSVTKITLTVLSVAQVLRVLELQEDTIYRLSEVDALTGAYNRRSIYAYFDYLWDYRNSWSSVSVIYFDLDKFKQVNDTFGHPIGDKVLVNAVKVVENLLPNHAILGRLGGEEFVVIVPNSDKQIVAELAQNIRKHIEMYPIILTDNAHIALNHNQHHLKVTASLGIATLYRQSEYALQMPYFDFLYYLRKQTSVLLDLPVVFDKLVNRADEAMYKAKITGRNQVITAKAMQFTDNI